MKAIKIIITLLIFFSLSLAYSQEIKVTKTPEGYAWQLTDYTLPDFIITYRIIDCNGKTEGATMDPEAFYTLNYMSSKTQKGIYTMLVYISLGEPIETDRKILFKKEFEIK